MEFNAYHMLFFVTIVASILYVLCGNTRVVAGSKGFLIKTIPFSLLCVIFILFCGLVGNVATDHMSYVRIYNDIRKLPFSDFLTWDYEIHSFEKGYGLLTWIIGQVFNHEQYLFIASAALMVIPVFLLAKKSSDPCYFIVVFLSIGYYFAGFNVIRQAVAASLAIILFKYAEKGEFVKFIIVDLFIALFHVSALILIPFYFLLRQKLSFKATVVWLSVFAVFSLGFYRIVGAVDGMFFSDKFTETGRLQTAVGLMNIIVPILVVVFCGFLTSQHKPKWEKMGISGAVPIENIEWNATLCWGMFWLLSLRFAYFERITYFFLPMVVLLVTDGINRYRRGNSRLILKIGFFLAVTVYYLVFGQYFKTYVFFFQ